MEVKGATAGQQQLRRRALLGAEAIGTGVGGEGESADVSRKIWAR